MWKIIFLRHGQKTQQITVIKNPVHNNEGLFVYLFVLKKGGILDVHFTKMVFFFKIFSYL